MAPSIHTSSRSRPFKNLFRPNTSRAYIHKRRNVKPPANRPPPTNDATRRLYERQDARRGQLHPGSTFSANLANVARALQEIRHYQAEEQADEVLIPQAAFARLVREIIYTEWKGRHLREVEAASINIEGDAIVILQQMSEHLLNDVFQMTYTPSSPLLT